MPNKVTAIQPRCDQNGCYHLEVTGDDGAKFEVLLPPEKELVMRTTIQQNEARRHAEMSFLGTLVLDVTRTAAAPQATGESHLLIETSELGLWALELTPTQLDKAILDLQSLRRGATAH